VPLLRVAKARARLKYYRQGVATSAFAHLCFSDAAADALLHALVVADNPYQAQHLSLNGGRIMSESHQVFGAFARADARTQ
jgi:hypothetical protein